MKTLWAVLLGGWTAAALAGVGEIPVPDAGTNLSPAPEPATQVVGARREPVSPRKGGPAPSRPTLRCWQYGRLIFEEPLASLPPEGAGPGYLFQGKAGQRSVRLLDIHTATCVIQ